MSDRNNLFRSRRLIACLLFSGPMGLMGLMTGRSMAAEFEPYAYLLLQGKVSGSEGGRPETGVTVRLTSKDRNFETRTDERGVFLFEKLPVAAYDLQIITADGRVMRSVRPFTDPRGIRLEATTGRGRGKAIHLEVKPPGDRVTFDVPEHAPDWHRFWKEFGIIVGTAGVFAL